MIEKCPFCNGKSFAEPPSLGRSHWNIVCDDCGASGPHGHDDEQAARRWNDRFPAIATEARRAETLGSVHEGAGPKGIAR